MESNSGVKWCPLQILSGALIAAVCAELLKRIKNEAILGNKAKNKKQSNDHENLKNFLGVKVSPSFVVVNSLPFVA
jgi:hypothetical protein